MFLIKPPLSTDLAAFYTSSVSYLFYRKNNDSVPTISFEEK